MSTERQHRRDIVSFGRALHERGYVAAMDGNLSVRLGENRILATPTAMCKGVMRPSDLVIVDMQGRRLGGKRDVSSEIAMHLLIYRLRPDMAGINSSGEVRHARHPGAHRRAGTLGSTVRCDSDVEPWRGCIRQRPESCLHEDGNSRAFCANRARDASARTAATAGQRGARETPSGA